MHVSSLNYPLKLIGAACRIYESVKHSNIASDNDLPPARPQAIILPNIARLSIKPRGTYFS